MLNQYKLLKYKNNEFFNKFLIAFNCFYLLSLAFNYFHLFLLTFTCVFFFKKGKCAGTPNYYTTEGKKQQNLLSQLIISFVIIHNHYLN